MRVRWMNKLDWALVQCVAKEHDLEPELVAAVVQVESAGNTYACRYEPKFKHVFRVPEFARLCGCTAATMFIMQKTSWGLMQVMGSVAYEHGLHTELIHNNKWPTALTNPEIGLKYGCLHLKLKYEKYGPTPGHVYAAYNAGSLRLTKEGKLINEDAVQRFLRHYEALKK